MIESRSVRAGTRAVVLAMFVPLFATSTLGDVGAIEMP